uniref:Uncharacterized protein n=1 Tax=Nothobranchius pienaari TaxID=704102 RepID=A0A1A8LEJ7_9TELE
MADIESLCLVTTQLECERYFLTEVGELRSARLADGSDIDFQPVFSDKMPALCMPAPKYASWLCILDLVELVKNSLSDFAHPASLVPDHDFQVVVRGAVVNVNREMDRIVQRALIHEQQEALLRQELQTINFAKEIKMIVDCTKVSHM